jgi:hypothetical protein
MCGKPPDSGVSCNVNIIIPVSVTVLQRWSEYNNGNTNENYAIEGGTVNVPHGLPDYYLVLVRHRSSSVKRFGVRQRGNDT